MKNEEIFLDLVEEILNHKDLKGLCIGFVKHYLKRILGNHFLLKKSTFGSDNVKCSKCH